MQENCKEMQFSKNKLTLYFEHMDLIIPSLHPYFFLCFREIFKI